MPRVSDEHREQRRVQILEGARRAFARHGYTGATVARLEEEIGLSRGAIFNYFPNKWDIFLALADADRRKAGELWLSDGFEAVARQMANEDPDWAGVYMEALRMLRTHPELREHWGAGATDLEQRIRERLARDQQRGTLRADMTPSRLMGVVGVMLNGIAAQKAAGGQVDVEPVLAVLREGLSARRRHAPGIGSVE
ncbi:MAG TPA: helix-turn-helix domain-containing protein [Gaiellales bacterium]|nr:helix-turn-helix domain-containing protein [Gaiellales bacterium]